MTDFSKHRWHRADDDGSSALDSCASAEGVMAGPDPGSTDPDNYHHVDCPLAPKLEVEVREAAPPVTYDQALIDSAQREVERVALKYGVPRECLPRAIADFSRHLTPHAGRAASVHAVTHYKRWFRGWADGWRAAQAARKP